MERSLQLNLKALGKNLKLRREELHLTQQDVADMIGLAHGSYQQIERGERQTGLDTLVSICNCLELDIGAVLAADLDPNLVSTDSKYIDLFKTSLKLNRKEIELTTDFINMLLENRKKYR